MENVELIVSLAATAAGTLIACATFVVKLIAALRARVRTEGKSALLDAAVEAVETAETLSGYDGSEKKAYAIGTLNRYAQDNGIEFDFEAVSARIERLIELSKRVNKREDKQDKEPDDNK